MNKLQLSLLENTKNKKILEKLFFLDITTIDQIYSCSPDILKTHQISEEDYKSLCEEYQILERDYKDVQQSIFQELKVAHFAEYKDRISIPLYFMTATSIKSKAISIQNRIANLNKVIAYGEITEICAAPGLGKTNICLGLCINAQLSLASQKLEVLYLDCEGGFNLKRLRQMTESIINSEVNGRITVVECLEKIYYKRILDYIDLDQVLNSLEDYIKGLPQVKIVIIDSFTTTFGLIQDRFNTQKYMNIHLERLRKLAKGYSMAFVLTNLLPSYDKMSFLNLQGNNSDYTSSIISNRIKLGKENKKKWLLLEKTSGTNSLVNQPVEYTIGERGIIIY